MIHYHEETTTSTLATPIRIAFAEDHRAMRVFMTNYIESQPGLQVCIQAADGLELITQIEESSLLPDICLLDIRMPDPDGFETLRMLLGKWPSLKCIMLSAYITKDNIIRALAAGAKTAISKDDDPDLLIDAISSIHHHGYYNSPALPKEIIRAARNKTLQPLKITDQEMKFLKLCCRGLSYKEIASIMEVSLRTIHGYKDALCNRLNVRGREGLIIYAYESGLITNPTDH